MYEAHFGLRELPFSLTPNTDYLVGLTSHQECLTLVRVALAQGEGFVKVTGEVGTGKTLLCRELLATLDENQYQLAYVPNPDLTPAALHRILAQELHLKVPSGTPSHELLEQINQRLIEIAQQGRSTVLLIDEAQALSRETLEAVRLLTNLETTRKKLLQVVLFGQPELDETLDSHDLRQLRQRITFSYRLQPMDEAQTRRYVMHRLSMAGYKGEDLLDGLSYRLLARGTRGIPRLVNITCHKAMMVAYGKGERQIHWRHIRRALADNGRDGGSPLLAWIQHRRRWLATGAAAIALTFAASAYVQRLDSRPATAAQTPAPSPARAPVSARVAAPEKTPPPAKPTPDTTVAPPTAPARAAAPAPPATLTAPSPAQGVLRPASAEPAAGKTGNSAPAEEPPAAPKAAEASTPAPKTAAASATAASPAVVEAPARQAASPGASPAVKPAAPTRPEPAAGAQPAEPRKPAPAAGPAASAGRAVTAAKAAAPTKPKTAASSAPKAAATPAIVVRPAATGGARPATGTKASAGTPTKPVASRAAVAPATGAARSSQPPAAKAKAMTTRPAAATAPSALMSTADVERARAAAAARTAAPGKAVPSAQAPAAAANRAP